MFFVECNRQQITLEYPQKKKKKKDNIRV
ncbi:hypothetical protein ACJIZ3_018570 [Penstemon smallii]|uniref:Uncharacterized protein n=1 Tax=Penstemon smallii TaxID=265156 RepID=A0ABD3SZX4_9LAMI